MSLIFDLMFLTFPNLPGRTTGRPLDPNQNVEYLCLLSMHQTENESKGRVHGKRLKIELTICEKVFGAMRLAL